MPGPFDAVSNSPGATLRPNTQCDAIKKETKVLTQEQLDFYRENGYLLVKGVFTSGEAAALRAEAHALIDLCTRRRMSMPRGARRSGAMTKTSLLHCHDVQFYSAMLTQLLVDDRLTGGAADIIGSPNVQLHHNKLFIKPPEKGSPFPMHQDRPFFPHDNDTMITAIIHFDDAPVEKGCVRVVPGSHKLGPVPHIFQRVAGTCRWTSIRWNRRWRARRRRATCSSSPT